MQYLIITYKNHRHTTKKRILTAIMSYLPLISERITTTHICQGLMYRRWSNRSQRLIESRSRKLATLELLGSFPVYGGYYLFVYLVATSNLNVQCWKVNQPYCVVKNITNNTVPLQYQIIYGTQSQLELRTFNLQMSVKFSNRTAGLLVGGSKHL